MAECSPQNESAYPRLLKCSPEASLWWTFTWETNICIPLIIHRSLYLYLFPKFLYLQFSNHGPSKFLTLKPRCWLQCMNCSARCWLQCSTIAHMPDSSLKQSTQPGALLEVLPTENIFLHHCPSEVDYKSELQLCTFRWYLHIMQNHLQTSFKSSFPWSTDHRWL